MKYLLPVCFFLFPFCLPAVTLEELFLAARTKDRSLAAMDEQDRQRFKRYELEDLEQGWQYELSSGDVTHQTSKEDEETRKLSASPSTSLTLPYPLETKITLESPFELNMTDETDCTMTGRLKIQQPLNPVLGIERDEILKMERRSRESFESNLNRFRHEKNLEQAVVTHLINIFSNEKELLDLRSKELRKSLMWDTAVRFGTLGAGTKAELTLKMELNKLAREKLQLQQTIDESRRSLEYLTGYYLSELPELPGFSVPSLPMSEQRLEAANLKLQRWELLIRQEELRETRWRELPQLALSGILETTGEQKAGTPFSLEGQKGGFSLESRGETVDIRGGAVFGDEEFTITGGFSWKTRDRRKDRLEEEIKESEVQQQTLVLEGSYPDHFEKEQAVLRRIDNIRIRQENILEDSRVAEQAIREQTYSHEKGFISDMELEEGQIARKVLEYEKLLLILESVTLQLDIDKYYFTDNQKEG